MEQVGDNDIPCELEIQKNIARVEFGGELTIPLSKLNKSCKFKKVWNKTFFKWHRKEICMNCYNMIYPGDKIYKYNTCSKRCEEMARKSQREYRKKYYLKNKKEINDLYKKWRDKIKKENPKKLSKMCREAYKKYWKKLKSDTVRWAKYQKKRRDYYLRCKARDS